MPITETVRRTMHANAARKSRFTDPYYNSIDETQEPVTETGRLTISEVWRGIVLHGPNFDTEAGNF